MKKQSVTRVLLSLCVAVAMCIALAIPGFAATQKNTLFAGAVWWIYGVPVFLLFAAIPYYYIAARREAVGWKL